MPLLHKFLSLMVINVRLLTVAGLSFCELSRVPHWTKYYIRLRSRGFGRYILSVTAALYAGMRVPT